MKELLNVLKLWISKKDDLTKYHKLQIPTEINALSLIKTLDKELKEDIVSSTHLLLLYVNMLSECFWFYRYLQFVVTSHSFVLYSYFSSSVFSSFFVLFIMIQKLRKLITTKFKSHNKKNCVKNQPKAKLIN